jgi:ABC-type amino acid transport substrate-binding protein
MAAPMPVSGRRDVLVCAVGLLIAGTAHAAEPPWLVYCSNDFPPYCWADPVKGAVGMDVEIVRALLQRARAPYIIEQMAWSRAIVGLEQARCDLLFGMVATPERRRDYHLVGSFRDGEIAFAVRADSVLTFNTLDDLQGLTIGTALRNSYGSDFDRATHFSRDPARNDELSLLKLAAGRVDMVVGDRFALEWKARHLGVADQVRLLPKPLVVSPHYIGLPFNRSDKAARLEAALMALRVEGAIDAIVQRWRETG